MADVLVKAAIFIFEGACPCLIFGSLDQFLNAELVTIGRVENVVGNMIVITLIIVAYGTLWHKSLQARESEVVITILEWPCTVGLWNSEVGIFYFGCRRGMMYGHLIGRYWSGRMYS